MEYPIMRKKNRERSLEFALNLIENCEYAFLSTTNEDNSPYCIPVSPILYDGKIYIHCARIGQKLDNIKRNNNVCLSCAADTKVIDKEYSTEFSSAVIYGKAKIIEDESEKIKPLFLIAKKYTENDNEGIDNTIKKFVKATNIIEITILHATGKEKKF